MTTIVVHGTQTHSSAIAGTWWWNSWSDTGFLGSVARGMEQAAGWHDVWRVKDVPVAQIPDLTATRSFWRLSLTPRSLSQHQGHFFWSGAAMGLARDAGASALVAYLNAVRALTDEPLRIIAHSHGCNLVKQASASRKLAPDVFIARAAFLACPHFYAPDAAPGYRLPYKLAPKRFGRILNLYTPSDTVQVNVASHLSGQTITASLAGMQAPKAFRTEQDPGTHHIYENAEYSVAQGCSGTQAHTVAHGSILGAPVGAWLAGDASFGDILRERHSGHLPAVPASDDGA